MSLATGVAAAQVTQTKETVPGGAAKVQTVHLKGELVATGTNWLIAKDATGYYRLYGTATTTETPLINRTTTITQGTVFWASPKSIIVTLEGGENKQYEVPSGFTFDVDGKKLASMELRPGMKLTGTKIVEEPMTVITEDVIVTGTVHK